MEQLLRSSGGSVATRALARLELSVVGGQLLRSLGPTSEISPKTPANFSEGPPQGRSAVDTVLLCLSSESSFFLFAWTFPPRGRRTD